MAKKLQNIKAIKEMIAGTHRSQTKNQVGMYSGESHQIRKVGDIWEETVNGTVYEIEQKDGFRVKKPKNSIATQVRDFLNSFPNCKKDCKCTNPTHLDKKMRILHGMCFNCVVEMEHKLRKQGKFEEYTIKLRNQHIDKVLEGYKNFVQDRIKESNQNYVTEDGDVESWKGGVSKEQLEKDLQEGIEFLESMKVK